jgi:hypothetical protein
MDAARPVVRARAGATLLVTLQVTLAADAEAVAITDRLPAGLEPVDLAFAAVGALHRHAHSIGGGGGGGGKTSGSGGSGGSAFDAVSISGACTADGVDELGSNSGGGNGNGGNGNGGGMAHSESDAALFRRAIGADRVRLRTMAGARAGTYSFTYAVTAVTPGIVWVDSLFCIFLRMMSADLTNASCLCAS